MGKDFDKHGRRNWHDEQNARLQEICGKCGKKVQDMLTHNALFHPEYRSDVKKPPDLIPLDPADSRLTEYGETQ